MCDTLFNMVSSFLMSRQLAYMTTSNSQFRLFNYAKSVWIAVVPPWKHM